MVEAQALVLLTKILLTVFVVVIAFYDLRERRIPNLIVFPAALIGLILHSLQSGERLFFSFKGLFVGFALLLIPYLLKVMGAGDVKFLAAIGAYVGAAGVTRVLLLSLLVYPMLALFFVLQQKKMKMTLRRFGQLTSRMIGVLIPQFRLYADQLRTLDDPGQASATSPFGLTVSAGTILALYTNFLS